jgi:hypothetical protein
LRLQAATIYKKNKQNYAIAGKKSKTENKQKHDYSNEHFYNFLLEMMINYTRFLRNFTVLVVVLYDFFFLPCLPPLCQR